MLEGTVLPGNPASAAVELTPAQIAACAHALGVAREARFRLAEMSADDVVALRELTAAIDALEAEVSHGEAATIVLTAARLLLVAQAVRDFVVVQEAAEVLTEASRRHLRTAAELIDPLAELASRALSSALVDVSEAELDDDAFDALLRDEERSRRPDAGGRHGVQARRRACEVLGNAASRLIAAAVGSRPCSLRASSSSWRCPPSCSL